MYVHANEAKSLAIEDWIALYLQHLTSSLRDSQVISHLFCNALLSEFCPPNRDAFMQQSLLWFCDTVQIECDFRIAWRLDFNDGTMCNSTDVAENRLIAGPGSSLLCIQGCSPIERVDRLQYQCTEFSNVENWSQGVRKFRFSSAARPQRLSFWYVTTQFNCRFRRLYLKWNILPHTCNHTAWAF